MISALNRLALRVHSSRSLTLLAGVHPPFGKWIIFLGLQLFGADSPFGWRFSTALLGTLVIPLVIFIAWRLIGSRVFALLAGLFIALEGQSIVMSRTAILDGILTFMVVLGLAILVIADSWWRDRVSAKGKATLTIQPWLILLGVVMGLASSVKWSGLYFLAFFGIYTFLSDLRLRRKLNLRQLGAWLQGLINAVTLLLFGIAAYIISWSGWILGTDGWGRQAEGTWWQSLWAYHQNAFSFHTNLDSEHPYEANAFQWLLALRPTAFFFERFEDAEICGALGDCTVAITAIPNLVVFFGGLLALLWLLPRVFSDRTALVLVLGFLAGWLPWVIYLDRTVFQFYTVVLMPFFAIALTYVLHHYWRTGVIRGWRLKRERRIGYLVLATVLVALYFTSIWMGLATPDWVWRIQMLLPIWI
ncbi:MAG: phospholipid carrier-dependent glycosyltransferase [Actinobacteria bacterium]|nr:phospholipid carrier-dependent glycosyltransferase [Actinomycetota bacterium]